MQNETLIKAAPKKLAWTRKESPDTGKVFFERTDGCKVRKSDLTGAWFWQHGDEYGGPFSNSMQARANAHATR